MKIEVERDALVNAIAHVNAVVESRNAIPVLSNVLIEAAGGVVSLTATNLDQQATVEIDGTGECAITVHGAKMLAAAQSLKPGKLSIEGRESKLVARQGKAQRVLPTLPAADFPKRKPIDGGTQFAIAASTLRRLLETAHIAMSAEEVRYYLNGIFLHHKDGELIAVATDGHRLVKVKAAAPEGAGALVDVIIPSKAITYLRKLVSKEDGEIDLIIGDTAIEARFGGAAFWSKLIDGTFPDYTRVIPAGGGSAMDVHRSALVDAIDAVAAIIAAEGEKVKIRGVTLDLKAEGGGHQVTGRDSAGAFSEEPLDGSYDGPAMRVGLNAAYAKAAGGIFAETARLKLEFAGERDPVLITSDKDPDLIAVVMPMLAHEKI